MIPGLALSLGWERPTALWSLVLPLLFLLALRLLARSPRRVTGTLELWKELAPARPRGLRRGGRIPPWALVAAVALVFGALAWSGPRGGPRPTQGTWTCVVDRSASMGLTLAPDGSRTRLDAALDAATEWLQRRARSGERVRWIARGRETLLLAPVERPSGAWLDLEGDAAGEPDWAQYDSVGTLWISDHEPAAPRSRAGLFASGGPAVEGPIAADGRETVLWEGDELRTIASPLPLAFLVKTPAGRDLPPVLERVLTAWASARGLLRATQPRTGTVLVVELRSGAGEERELFLSRDGWVAAGNGAALPDLRGAVDELTEDWLLGTGSDGVGQAVVRARTGRIEVSLATLSEPRGDPASFALSFGRLFDRWARRPPGVLPLEERLAAGESRMEPTEGPHVEQQARDDGPFVDAALALAASLCAALAWLLRARD